MTGIFGWMKTRQDRRTEHVQWLRNHKVAVYTEFLKQARLIDIHIEEALSLRSEAMEPLRNANRQISTTAIRIAAPEKVGSASNRVKNAISDLGDTMEINATPEQKASYEESKERFYLRLNELEDLMREDLDITD